MYIEVNILESWIIEVMNQFGYLGITLLILIENLFPPIPSEVILTFGGFMTTYTNLKPVLVILFSTVGSVIGAIILYYLGKLLSPKRINKILDSKFGRMLGFKKQDINKACNWFNKKGKNTVFFCRCIPILRSLISIPAGISSMEILPFILMTTIGSLIWNAALVYLGVVVGASWKNISEGINMVSNIVLILLIALAIVGLILLYLRKKKTKS